MNLTCSRNILSTALGAVGSVIPSKTPKPILQCVKLEIQGNKANLIATDSEISIRYTIPEVVSSGVGEALLPATRVSQILRELREEQIQLEFSGEKTRIRTLSADFQLPSIDPSEFPPVQEFHEQDYISVPAKQLREMIRRTVFATDVESTRFALGGILLDIQSDKLTMVATDTRRLAVVRGTCSPHGAATPRTAPPVVPSKTMQLLERITGESEGDVKIALKQNEVQFETPFATITSRLVEGRFPKYQDVIPQSGSCVANLVADTFHQVVRQSRIVTNEESRGVEFTFGDGKLLLVSRAADIGESRVELPIDYSGTPLTVIFDPRYIEDFLKVLPAGTAVRLEMLNADAAALLKTEDGYQYVIMPVAKSN